MKKRALATLLWFYAGWYLGATIAAFLGVEPAFGILLGVVAAVVTGVDPWDAIWKRDAGPAPRHASAAVPAGTEPA